MQILIDSAWDVKEKNRSFRDVSSSLSGSAIVLIPSLYRVYLKSNKCSLRDTDADSSVSKESQGVWQGRSYHGAG